MSRSQRSSASIFALLLAPRAAFASEGIDSGDTAWILTSTALVLFMTTSTEVWSEPRTFSRC
jgi:hypothetical protein